MYSVKSETECITTIGTVNSRLAHTLAMRTDFVASSLVLIFAVIGHNAINIPEIFQVFTIFPVPL